MKTKVLLLGAACAAFAFNTFAGDAFLSPRAKDNQIKVVRNSTETQAAVVASTASTSPILLSPRAANNQLKTVSGTVNERNPYLEFGKNMTGSPKAVQASSENAAQRASMTIAPLK